MKAADRTHTLVWATLVVVSQVSLGCSSSSSPAAGGDDAGSGESSLIDATTPGIDAGVTPGDDAAPDGTTNADAAGMPAEGGAGADAMAATDATAHGVAGIVAAVSVDADGGAIAGSTPHISADGRYVSFVYGSNQSDLYLRDTCLGSSTPAGCSPSTIPLSIASDGSATNAGVENWSGWLTGDGRFAVLLSASTNLLAAATTGLNAFVRDTCLGQSASCTPTTFLASVSTGGAQGNEASDMAAVSAGGRVIAFKSGSTNLSTPAPNGRQLIYARDTCLGAAGCTPSTILVSPDIATNHTNTTSGSARNPTVSDDGRYVAYESDEIEVTPGTNNNVVQAYLRDTCVGVASACTPTTVLVTAAADGSPGNGGSEVSSMSADARFVVFDSLATNLVTNSVSGTYSEVYVRDTCTGPSAPSGCTPKTTLVSLALDGSSEGHGDSFVPYATAISADGRFVQFGSKAQNLVTGATQAGAFVRDTCVGAPAGCVPSTVLVSVDSMGNQVAAPSSASSTGLTDSALSRDGHYVAFDLAGTGVEIAATGF